MAAAAAPLGLLDSLHMCTQEGASVELKKRRDLQLHELELPGEVSIQQKLTVDVDVINLEDVRSESSKSTAQSDSGPDTAGKVEQTDSPEADEDDEDSELFAGAKGLGVMKRAWAPEEDSRLLELVEEFGPRRWSVIAQHLQGRVGKQCRER
jgi:hypothetical protein